MRSVRRSCRRSPRASVGAICCSFRCRPLRWQISSPVPRPTSGNHYVARIFARRGCRPLRTECACARRRDRGTRTPRHRFAIVNGGTSIAVALGVPLGAMVGYTPGWRMTICRCWVSLASTAVAGLYLGIPRGIDSSLSVPSIRERLLRGTQGTTSHWFPHYHAMGDRRVYGLYLFHILSNHGHSTRRRLCRNSLLRLGRIGCCRLISGRHAE